MDTWKNIRDREFGKLQPNSFANRIKSNRISQLQLSNHKELISSHKGAVNSLQIDLTEGRYLLSSASDASVAVYDVQRPSDYTGVVVNFKMPGKVYKTAMSTLSTSHMLIAVGTEDVQVRLCDIASGAFAHTLSGHRDGVMSVEWSASSEWVLITGGCDGAIRFWDIRRAGCFQVLNQSRTQLGRRPPILKHSMLTKESSTKMRVAQKKLANGSGSGQLPIGRLSSKGPMKQKLHPGLLSTQDRATAHYGAVTGLKVTEDGMYLLSAGSDSRLRLWDIESGCDTLVNFETVRLQTSRPIQLATAQDSALVFVPCMRVVKAFDMWSGNAHMVLRGHYESVNSCWFNQQDQELYTGGNDRQILVWSPARSIADEMGEGDPDDQDSWSN
ncbi:hypothetical protein TSUD_316050 [Trifolium subterraneum]|uniref:Uncharacterized protein n=1 Tax=Trifolium subterraneum TaxID=3900 RepID=A0A2Z6N4Z7_TRISU|nr:hypothetical protein TSUD_316050 [Trifolium subterraneum]